CLARGLMMSLCALMPPILSSKANNDKLQLKIKVGVTMSLSADPKPASSCSMSRSLIALDIRLCQLSLPKESQHLGLSDRYSFTLAWKESVLQ
ncbi:hypothetical protein V8C86DRAFT_2706486, partial [Haematococcus lacustris]